MKHNNILIVISVVISSLITSCGSKSKTDGNEPVLEDQLIKITQKQVDSEKIEFGETTNYIFKERISCNGYIMAPTNAIAQISTPISGILESINCSLGSLVNKGEKLCMLSSNELMIIQQDFAETSANLNRLKADYERSKTLYNENIGAEKDFIAIESEYKGILAKYSALKLRLELLHLNVSKVENGEFYSVFPVVAPIKGYITEMNLVLGQYTEQQNNLLEIVDVDHLQLELSVFQDDISKLKTGQKIHFNSLGESGLTHRATLISIGKTINPESRAITCIANIENEEGKSFINKSYIEASVIVNEREAKALPDDAILKTDKDFYVLVVERSEDDIYYLRKEMVNIGMVSNGFSEILTGNFKGRVLIKGVYNLQSE